MANHGDPGLRTEEARARCAQGPHRQRLSGKSHTAAAGTRTCAFERNQLNCRLLIITKFAKEKVLNSVYLPSSPPSVEVRPSLYTIDSLFDSLSPQNTAN